MAPPISFSETPTLRGARAELRPLGPGDTDELLRAFDDEEVRRLTGTHATFNRAQIERYCNTRGAHDDRLDFAVVEAATGRLVGDMAIMDLDRDNRSCAFRIALSSDATGRGIGTEATRLVVAHLFDLGIHRVSLEVYDFNPRARHVYEQVGFSTRGDAARRPVLGG